MTSRKNQNSVLFLTTLGVYLGLVLVGATPQVLAQAATAKELSVEENKTKATSKDFDDILDEYFDSLKEFVLSLRGLRSIDKLNLSNDYFNLESVAYHPCPETGTGISHDSDSHIDRWVLPAIIEAKFVAKHLTVYGDCRAFDEFPNRKEARSAGIKLKLDKSEFRHEVFLNFTGSKNAKTLLDGLNLAVERYGIDADDRQAELKKVLFKNTQLTSVENQVFIITRLPRADLDSLLVTDAK